MYCTLSDTRFICTDYSADASMLKLCLKDAPLDSIISAAAQPSSIDIYTDTDDEVAKYVDYTQPISVTHIFETNETIAYFRKATDAEKEIAALKKELLTLKETLGGE